MSRPVTERMAQALRSGYKLALLAELDHPEGTLRYWSGVGDLIYQGNTFTGTSILGKISPVSYVSGLVIQEVIFEITGIPPQDEKWLTNDIRNRTGSAWLAALDRHGVVVADPKKIVKVNFDYPKYNPSDDGTVTIQLVGRSGFYTLERALDEVHSAEDQRRLFPGDSGCDLIPSLQQQTVIWKPS